VGKCAGAKAELILTKNQHQPHDNKATVPICCQSDSRHGRQRSKWRVRRTTLPLPARCYSMSRAVSALGTRPCGWRLAPLRRGLELPRPFADGLQEGSGFARLLACHSEPGTIPGCEFSHIVRRSQWRLMRVTCWKSVSRCQALRYVIVGDRLPDDATAARFALSSAVVRVILPLKVGLGASRRLRCCAVTTPSETRITVEQYWHNRSGPGCS
jgi:hypothetical protein